MWQKVQILPVQSPQHGRLRRQRLRREAVIKYNKTIGRLTLVRFLSGCLSQNQKWREYYAK